MPILPQGGTSIRISNDVMLSVARGDLYGYKAIHKFGANLSVAGSSTEAVSFTGLLGGMTLTTPTTVRIKAGGNAADTALGTGARSVTIVGLNADWQEVSETVATAGASASAPTTIPFIRVYRSNVNTVGTPLGVGAAGGNVGSITVESSGGLDLLAISAGRGQTEYSGFTIPAGASGYLMAYSLSVAPPKEMTLAFYQRRNGVGASPLLSKRMVSIHRNFVGTYGVSMEAYRMFPEKTDLWWEAENGPGGAGICSVTYDLSIVVND